MVDPREWIPPASELLIFLTLIAKPPPFRWAFFGLLLTLNSQAVLHYYPSNPFVAVGVGSSIGADIVRLFDALFLSDMRLVGQIGPSSSLDLWSRIKWAFQLRITPRGIGWQHEPKHAIPPHPENESRVRFIIRVLPEILSGVLCLDLIGLTSLYDPPAYLKTYNFWFYFRHVIHVWGNAFFGVRTGYNIVSVIAVFLQLGSPDDWPPMFGPLKEAYTMKRLWGRTWHQMLRKPITSPGRALAKQFGIKSGTNAHYYLLLYVAFLLSGIIHEVGDFTATRHLNLRATAQFLWFAVVISIEDLVFKIAEIIGVNVSAKRSVAQWRWLGYIWVLCCFAPPIWYVKAATGAATLGWWKLSPILGIYRGEWFPSQTTTL